MAKRIASSQLARDVEEQPEEIEETSNASQEILAKRKILQPRGKRFSLTPNSSASAPDHNARIKALNNKFVATVLESTRGNSVADLRDIARKYIQFYENTIGYGSPGGSNAARNTTQPKPENTNVFAGFQLAKQNNSLASPPVKSLDSQPDESSKVPHNGGVSFLKSSTSQSINTAGSSKDDTADKADPQDNGVQEIAPQENSNEEDTGGHFEPIASLGEQKVQPEYLEEEKNATRFSCRAKVMLFNSEQSDNPYKTIGVGDLKIIRSNDKNRLLVRADGGLRIILNTYLMKDLTYEAIGNGSLVRMPAALSDGTLATYVLRVKTPELGGELVAAMNNP